MNMQIMKMNKKNIIVTVKNIEDMNIAIKMFEPKFKTIPENLFNVVNEKINNTEVIGIKKFKKWYRKFIFLGINSSWKEEFWTNRGFSQEESKEIIRKVQSDSSKRKIRTPEQQTTRLEYYTSRGYSIEEARLLRSDRQKTFSLEKCINVYGPEEGLQRWKNRQEKWIKTLNNKTQEEKFDIKRKRTVPLGKASKESLMIFEPLYSFLLKNAIVEENEVYFGFKDKKEWFLADEKCFYLYDFCIPKLKLIFEYQGTVWHPRPDLCNEELLKWNNRQGKTGLEVKLHDDNKKTFAEERGYKVVYLWGHEKAETNIRIAFDTIKELVSTSLNVGMEKLSNIIQYSDIEMLGPDGFVPVEEFIIKENKKLIEVVVSNGKHVCCSTDHFIQTIDEKWLSSEEIMNEFLLGKKIVISTIDGPADVLEVKASGKGTVYDVSLNHHNHRYFANGIVSHNSGKSLLTIAAGLQQVMAPATKNNNGDRTRKYSRLIISRPIMPMGRDIGFLPGSLEEKMLPWLSPIEDNLRYLFSNDNLMLEQYMEKGIIEIEALSYIRGRSIQNAYIIIDECQSLTKHEVKTILTRAGNDSKIVLNGDTAQIDNPHVDEVSNGLTHAIEKFKEYDFTGHVTLTKGERSRLATIASQIL